MKNNPLRFSMLTVAGALAALLMASRPALADDSLTLILGARTPALMNTLNLVAEGAGFYKDEHLTVTRSSSNGALDAAQACSSGKIDICPIGIEPPITNYADGIRLKMFLSRASKFAYVIAVPEDSPIKTLADLKGKNIGVHVINAAASGAFTTTSTLSLAGLKPTDYSLVPIGYETQAADALASGKVSAAAFPYYEFIPFIVAGRKLRIFQHPTLKDVPNTGYAAAPSVLAAKKDQIRRFSRAIVKAALFIHYNAAASARLLLQADGKPFTDEDVQRKTAELNAWQDNLPAADPKSRRIGAFSEEGVQRYIQLLADSGVIKTPIPASEVVTDEFIKFANDFDHKAVEKLAKSMH
jgi:NitT/TauT family transport system substrate-binding protein